MDPKVLEALAEYQAATQAITDANKLYATTEDEYLASIKAANQAEAHKADLLNQVGVALGAPETARQRQAFAILALNKALKESQPGAIT